MSTDPLAIEDRDQLAAFLEDKSNAEIEAIAASVGVAAILARVFEVMEKGFEAAAAPDEPVVVQWDIADPAGPVHHWSTTARPDGCANEEGARSGVDVTLRLGFVTFLMIMAGRLKGMKALSTGKLKLKGDLLLATSIEKWFRAA